MAPLRNARHEAFTRGLCEGKSAHQAYIDAGYKPCRQNAARLTTKDDIQTRLTELQNAVAKDSQVTVASLLAELEDARTKAHNLDQMAAAIKAIEAKAKVSGLLTQKIEIGGPGSFDHCENYGDVADRLIADMIERFRPVDDSDREAVIVLLERHASELSELLNSIKARPICAERVDQANLTVPWQQLPPYTAPKRQKPPPRGNGFGR
jgi:hypothetical protein